MRNRFVMASLLVLAAGFLPAQMADNPKWKDHALFTRMPDFTLPGVEEKQYDRYEFRVQKDKKVEKVGIEGRFFRYHYYHTRKGAPPSKLQIVRNYQNAIKAIGGKVLWEHLRHDDEETTLFVSRDGKEYWAFVDPVNGGYDYYLLIVERQPMQQDVVANAAAFKSALADVGHVEVPGIYFDTGKSEVKPESQAALDELVKLLQGDPSLKVWVVGHTDNTGSLPGNMTLSNARAAAVVKALIDRRIDAKRLAAFGVGPYAPVTSNRTDDGRTKNRRVELVAMQ